MDRIQYHNGSSLNDLEGPPGPTHFVRVGPKTLSPRAPGDLLVDTANELEYDFDWIYPTYSNGWVHWGAPYSTARFRKLPGNLVLLDGVIKGGGINTPAFTLPNGYRPLKNVIMTSILDVNDRTRRVDIGWDGNVVPSGYNGYVSLCNILFYADGS